MAKLIYKKRVLPEAGRWLCTLMKVEETANKFYDPNADKLDKSLSLGWVFTYDQKSGTEIRIWTSPSLGIFKGKKSKALQVVESLLDKELTDQEKESFEGTDSLVGKKCYLVVKHVTRPDGSVYARSEEFESVSGKRF
ncbi:MAG: hypothetical protein WC851_05510 [Candidatus Shapirobacteria bacterium]|jgi:hypothetical protein